VLRLIPPVLALGLVTAGATGYLLFEGEPHNRAERKAFVRELASSVRLIEPGRFRFLGGHALYVSDHGDVDCPLEGILISDQSRPERAMYISARCGAVSETATSSRLGFDLYDGAIHFSDREPDRYRWLEFVHMRTELDLGAYIDPVPRARDLTFAELLSVDAGLRRGESFELRDSHPHAAVQTQIHRRTAFPFAGLLLAVVSVPLGLQPARSGRSAGALTAIAVMAVYWCLFTTGEIAAEEAYAPAWLAMWAPNVLVAAVGAWLLHRSMRGEG